MLRPMRSVGTRSKSQPAPPRVIFEALTQPHRDPARRWLELLYDEVEPEVIRSEKPGVLVWSSLWTRRPDAQIHFELHGAADTGTALRWTLLVDDPEPDAALTGHMCKRLNQLINANLRYTFGQ